MSTDDTPRRWVTIPWPGAAVALLAVAAMTAASVLAWPDMATEIVTREADGRHGRSVVGRGWSAVAAPGLLLGLTLVLSVAPRLEHELWSRFPFGRDRSAARAGQVFSWTLIGLSAVLTSLHLGVLSMHTGESFPLERAVAGSAGFLIVCLGIALPLAAPGGRFASERFERFRAALGPAYRWAGFALVIVGSATVVAAFLAPGAALTVAVGGLVVVMASVAARGAIAAR